MDIIGAGLASGGSTRKVRFYDRVGIGTNAIDLVSLNLQNGINLGGFGILFPLTVTPENSNSHLNCYLNDAVTLLWGGCLSPGISLAIRVTRIGRLVTLHTDRVVGPQGPVPNNIIISSALPVNYRPAWKVWQPIQVYNSGTSEFGMLSVDTSGVVNIAYWAWCI